jgi:hypothetical protein
MRTVGDDLRSYQALSRILYGIGIVLSEEEQLEDLGCAPNAFHRCKDKAAFRARQPEEAQDERETEGSEA